MAAPWDRANWWRVAGLAGLFTVAATGAVVTRNERQRRAYTPEQVRSRLHERLEQVGSAEQGDQREG